MHVEIKQNYQEKLRLVVDELTNDLDDKFKAMLSEHSAKGLIRSGDTIKRTMDFILESNAKLFQSVIEHMKELGLAYYPELESDIQSLAKLAQESFKKNALIRFQKSTELAGNPKLYERMLPELESGMATDLANFQNNLNAATVQLKFNNKMSPLTKVLWGLEAVLLSASIFIAGMWYKEPDGNYEPIVVGLTLMISFIGLGIKFSPKK